MQRTALHGAADADGQADAMPSMDDCFKQLAAECTLTASDARALDENGFTVIEGPLPAWKLRSLAEAYDRAMREASAPERAIGRTTTRVHDFVNRGVEFDQLYVHPPVLAACCRTIRQPFRLSSLLARTLHPRSSAQDLHVDFARDRRGWPMIGFIFMIDEFRTENWATRFVPGSHLTSNDATAGHAGPDAVAACGPPGAVIVYNGSVLHGHGPNGTNSPRRSLQGAYIRRDSSPAVDWSSRMRPETLNRIGPIAKYLVAG